MPVIKQTFGRLQDGTEISSYVLANEKAMAEITEYGARVLAFSLIGEDSVVAKYDSLKDYEVDKLYLGATVGRTSGIIKDGKISLSGKEIQLTQNMSDDHFNGGEFGFDTAVWDAEINNDDSVTFHLFSDEGESGYPAFLKATVTYKLISTSLEITFKGVGDADTVFAPTNCTYFNMGDEEIQAHHLLLNAEEMIEKGNINRIEGTPYDYTQYKKIGQNINRDFTDADSFEYQYKIKDSENRANLAGSVVSADRELQLNVYTTMPAVRLICRGDIDSSNMKNGGFAIMPNYPVVVSDKLPSTVLPQGKVFSAVTIYQLRKQQ